MSQAQAIDRETRAAQPIRHISIATRNRTAALVRAIESYAANLARFGREGTFWIIDDSDPGAEQTNAAALAQAGRALACGIRVSRARHRAALAGELARRTGVPADLVRFAFLGDPAGGIASHGACRNTMLAGLPHRFVSVDDDTICRMFAWPGQRDGATTRPFGAGHPALGEHAFFRSLADAVEAMAPVEQDFVATHEAMLGVPVERLVPASGDSSAPPSSAAAPLSRTVPRTVLSGLGLLGDCASEWTGYYLFLDSDTLARLSETPASLADYLQRRQVAIGVPQLTVWAGPPLRGMNLGLDNGALLPPFFPVDRDEDYVLADTLRRVMPEARYALHPSLLLHDPPDARATVNWWEQLSLVRASLVLKVVFESCDAPAAPSIDAASKTGARDADAREAGAREGPDAAMRAFGARIEAFASQPPAAFAATILDRVSGNAERKLADLRAIGLRHPNLDSAVRRVEQQVARLQAQADAPIRGYDANPARWQAWQGYARSYGQLLQAWPVLRRALDDLDLLGTRAFSAGVSEGTA